MNRYSEEDRQDLMFSCAYAAVQTGFQHLALRYILEPPTQSFDAKLARQIAIRIMNVEFDVPRRRIVTLQQRRRASIAFAIQTVEMRMEWPAFKQGYDRMAALAVAMYEDQVANLAT